MTRTINSIEYLKAKNRLTFEKSEPDKIKVSLYSAIH
jgi:hypothetical protein